MPKKIDTRREVEIELDFPVQLADRVLTKVKMRRPIMRDVIKHNVSLSMSMADSIALIAALCDLVPDEVELFDTVDFERLNEQLLAFRGDQKNGRNQAHNPAANAPVGN